MSICILVGDVREKLRELPADSFDCVVTSPPYWGLRDYDTARWEGGQADCEHVAVETTRTAWANKVKGPNSGGKNGDSYANMTKEVGGRCGKCGAMKIDAQIGLEPTLGEHLAVMVDVMREVRRVLKPTGTLWLSYGDCYATSPNGRSAADTKALSDDDRTFRDKPFSTIGGALKAKDLCMVPNRLAIALQEDGWWVRSEIIWAKPNPMPESIKDRPATAHEKIFLLSRAPRYHYDAEAVRQPAANSSESRWRQDVEAQEGSHRANAGRKTNGPMKAVGGPRKKQDATAAAAAAAAAGGSSGRRMAGFNERWDAKEVARKNENARGFRGGSYVGGEPGPRTETGNVPGTGDRSLRNYEPAPVQVWNVATQPFKDAHFATFPPELAERCLKAGCPAGGTVLDPFGGAGTTALVADRMGLSCTLIELSPKYAEIARKRIEGDAGMFSDVGVVGA